MAAHYAWNIRPGYEEIDRKAADAYIASIKASRRKRDIKAHAIVSKEMNPAGNKGAQVHIHVIDKAELEAFMAQGFTHHK